MAWNADEPRPLGGEKKVCADKGQTPRGVKMKIPLADSVILATARARAATIWTQDENFRNIAGVKYI
jgi:predicted nucleic acid-binding protein